MFVQISKWLSLLSLGLLLFVLPVQAQREVAEPFRPIEDDADLPRVLILGDSISIGYTLDTRRLLEGQAKFRNSQQRMREFKAKEMEKQKGLKFLDVSMWCVFVPNTGQPPTL